LRIDSFYDGVIFNLPNLKRVKVDKKTVETYSLTVGDIVINRVNSRKFLGKRALVTELLEETIFESNMMRFSVDTKRVNPGFIIALLQHNYIKRQILTKARDAVNQSSINQQDVKSLEVRLPPVEKQNRYVEIAKKSEELLNSINRWDQLSINLSNSLTQRAFRGEL